MEHKLKQEAQAYFGTQDYEKLHIHSAAANTLNKFYLLLIAKLLGTQELSGTIITFHTKAILDSELLLRSVWAYSLGLQQSKQSFKNLAAFISEIDRKSIVDRNSLLTILPENLNDTAGIAKKEALDRKARGAYTKYFYDQNKHNLFRQSNEGFAKMSLLLATLNSKHKTEVAQQKILSLIGNYDLDPDRVLDLIIQSYTQSNSSIIHFYLITRFKEDSIATLLGHRIARDCKLQHSQKIVYAGPFHNFMSSSLMELYKEQGFITHPKIIQLVVMLIKRSVITLQSIFSYLLPHDSVFERLEAQRIQFGKQRINKTFKIMLEQSNEAERKKQKQEDQITIFGQFLYSSKLAIITEFIRQNDWENFKIVWGLYENKIDLLTYQPLLHALYDMLQWIIEPVYTKISFGRFIKSGNRKGKQFQVLSQLKTEQVKQINQISIESFKNIEIVLKIISEYIGLKSSLFIKLCRLFKKIVKEPSIFLGDMDISENLDSIKDKIKEYTFRYLVPGVNYQTQNQVIANQIFDLLQCFNYQFRYSCYAKVYKQTMVKNPYQAYIFQKTKNKQNIIVNNLSEENKKMFIKKMAKLTHNQSLQVFYWIFRRLMMEDYEAVIPQIVSVLSACNPLTLQCTVFIVLHCLTEQKQPTMKFKTGEQLSWFKNLTKFTSLFFRKYLDTDITPIFDFIITKLSEPIRDLEDNQQLPGSPLLILKALLNKMFGNFMMQDINKSKYEIMCAGQLMHSEAMYLTSEVKAAKKSKVALESFFWESAKNDHGSLSFNLLILLAQKRAEFMHKTLIGDLKIIGDIYDNFSSSIIQLIRFLNYQASDYEKYSKLLPPNFFDLLINQYKIPLEIAFEIYRPSVKNISFMTNEEFEALSEEISSKISLYIANDNKLIEGYNVEGNLMNYLNENLSKVQNIMPKSFFTAFWFLTPDSIYFPEKLYADKIEELKKKIEMKMPSKRTSDRDEKQLIKAKSLYEKLKAEEDQQRRKFKETMSNERKKWFYLDFLRNPNDKTHDPIQVFAEVFVQVCLLPRLLMDPSESLFCFKFTIQMIRSNASASNLNSSNFLKNIIRLLTYIIEYVMNYLPFATQRQASSCLSIFLAEILGIFINWNDMYKLKSDLNKCLQMNPDTIEEKYSKLKNYLLTIYERVGSLIKSIKQQPYNIKNCLYLLQKVQSIPGYKQQAEDLQSHMKSLKQTYTTLDMQTILERQVSMLNNKKQYLPQKSEDLAKKKQQLPQNSNQKREKSKSPQNQTPKHDYKLMKDKVPEKQKINDPLRPQHQPKPKNAPVQKSQTKQTGTIDDTNSKKHQKQQKQSSNDNKALRQQPQKQPVQLISTKPLQNNPGKQGQIQISVRSEAAIQNTQSNTRKPEGEVEQKKVPQKILTVKEVKEARIQLATKKNDQIPQGPQTFQAPQTPHQKDVNEKFSSIPENKNQILGQNFKGEGPNLQQNDSKQRKHRQRDPIKDRTAQSRLDQTMDNIGQKQDKQQKSSQVQVDSIQGNKLTKIQQSQAKNKKEPIKQNKEGHQQPESQARTPQNGQSDKQISIKFDTNSQSMAIKQHKSKEPNIPDYRQQVSFQNREASQSKVSKKSLEKKEEQNKNYKQAKYNQESNKRDNYEDKKRREKDKQREKEREREKSKSKDRYKYKGRDDYRQRREERHKDDKDRSHRKQDRYDRDRDRKYDSKGSNKHIRDRHYHK